MQHSSSHRVLLLGAGGKLGRHALRGLLQWTEVTATARDPLKLHGHQGNFRPTVWPLDYLSVNQNPPSGKFDLVVLCTGISQRQKCELEPEQSRAVNVEGPLKVLQLVADERTRVVVSSTDLLLQPPTTFGAYERQKLELEGEIRQRFPHHLILRFGKLLDASDFVGCRWLEQLQRGEALTIYPQRSFSPVSAPFIEKFFARLASGVPEGVMTVSASDEWSYLQLAHWLYARSLRQSVTAMAPNDLLVRRRDVRALGEFLQDLVPSSERVLDDFFAGESGFAPKP